jgi:hypothetical protein
MSSLSWGRAESEVERPNHFVGLNLAGDPSVGNELLDHASSFAQSSQKPLNLSGDNSVYFAVCMMFLWPR